MVNERIIIFGVISDGLIVGQLSAEWREATRGAHDVRGKALGFSFTLKNNYEQDFKIKAFSEEKERELE